LVVTFAFGAVAIAGGCGGKEAGLARCPAEQPTQGAPCDVPSSAACWYRDGACGNWLCQKGAWVFEGCPDDSPPPVYEAGPAAAAAPDGEGRDGGHD
jgi:hypothetical protein